MGQHVGRERHPPHDGKGTTRPAATAMATESATVSGLMDVKRDRRAVEFIGVAPASRYLRRAKPMALATEAEHSRGVPIDD